MQSEKWIEKDKIRERSVWKTEIGKMEEIGSKWSKEKDTGIRSEKMEENFCLLLLAMILKILKIFHVTLPVLTYLSARELLVYIAAF